MSDFVIRTGDLLQVTVPPPALVPAVAAPVPLTGTGRTVEAQGAAICLSGDELPVPLRGELSYTAPPFTTPGTGKLTLMLLPPNLSKLTECGKPILLKGAEFVAAFTVTTPATQQTPTGPVPDGQLVKTATAQFITANATVAAS